MSDRSKSFKMMFPIFKHPIKSCPHSVETLEEANVVNSGQACSGEAL